MERLPLCVLGLLKKAESQREKSRALTRWTWRKD